VTLICITNLMDDQHSCTLRGQHQITCDGWEYRWSTDQHLEVATGRECRGCQPREAKHGLLCWECWQTVLTAALAVQDEGGVAPRINRRQRVCRGHSGGCLYLNRKRKVAMTDDELIARLRAVAMRAAIGAYAIDLTKVLTEAADRLAELVRPVAEPTTRNETHNPWDGQCVKNGLGEPSDEDARCFICRPLARAAYTERNNNV
jgi:hypothetical protein